MILSYILLALAALFCFFSSLGFCHMFQLEGYKSRRYFAWLGEFASEKIAYITLLTFLYGAASALFVAGRTLLTDLLGGGFGLSFLFFGLYYFYKFRQRNIKKPLDYTWRVRRMLFTLALLILAFSLGAVSAGLAIYALFILLTPLLILIANLINAPVEFAARRHYLKDAEKKLAARPDLIRIGITGSYGKTSTKFILGTILSEKYSVLVPQGSYNTPMGVTRVIRESLKDTHQVFIAEMGAKNVGDIAELVELVRPQYGILTSVGPQHLESFKTIENVASTKYELIEGLPENGAAFFCDDGGIVKELYDQTTIEKRLYALSEEGYAGEADVTADEITSGKEGSAFRVTHPGGSFYAKTKLLGKHNVLNIAGAVSVAFRLGLSQEEIVRGIGKIEPVEHRLQIIPTSNGIMVIDDAFNSNPEGARVAMEVLSGFEGRKFVVTPGMVELGEREEQENRAFGHHIGETADYAFLVGKRRTRPIYEGIQESGFDMEKVYVTDSLVNASEVMGKMLKPGDVVLFENDLPDNYNE